MKCPCEECLVFPICRLRDVIWCSTFRKYADVLYTKYYSDPELYWQKIKEILPNTRQVFSGRYNGVSV